MSDGILLIVMSVLFLAAASMAIWLLILRIRDREALGRQSAESIANEEKLRWLETARQELQVTFKGLASEVLRTNTEDLTTRARDELQTTVKPLSEKLKELDSSVRQMENRREGAYKSLEKELSRLADMHNQLQSTTTSLTQALRSPTVRGRWGELQLRRIVELAGMSDHIDFDEQATGTSGRPDMIVHLPQDAILPIDSKVPLDSYLDAMELTDPAERSNRMQLHARALKDHVRALGSKGYWEQFGKAPDFVVMFVPNEACLGAAYEADKGLIEFAIERRVLISSPVNLVALLKTVAYGWQQHQAADQAREILDKGREFHGRARTFAQHLQKVGKGLGTAVEGFNKAIGSYQSRLLPSGRRFEELAGASEPLPEVPPIESTPLRIEESGQEDDSPDAESERAVMSQGQDPS